MKKDYMDRIQAVISYIERNMDQTIDLDKLSEVSSFSKYHFLRVFYSITGKTPLAYVTQRRLQRSLAYLVETKKSILEISLLCGFKSASRFNSSFKKYFKTTPSEVRKKVKNLSNYSLQFGNLQEVRNPINITG